MTYRAMLRLGFVMAGVFVLLVLQTSVRDILWVSKATPNDAKVAAALLGKGSQSAVGSGFGATTEALTAATTPLPKNQCLKFLHIPKTGGTTIEEVARQGGVSWGFSDPALHCANATPYALLATSRRNGLNRVCDFGNYQEWVHHIPPYWDPILRQSYSPCEIFCVVRHPVDRLRSVWKFHSEHGWWKSKNQSAFACNADSFREFVHEYTSRSTSPLIAGVLRDLPSWLPQTEYVFDQNGDHVCKHVLRFENFEQGFNQLMARFGLHLKIQGQHIYKANIKCELAVPQDMLSYIKQVYAADFDAFGYI